MSEMTEVCYERVSAFQTGLEGVDVVVTTSGLCRMGHSEVPFNLGLNVEDDPVLVQARREQVSEFMRTPVCWLDQVHGCQFITVESLEHASKRHLCDASVTARTDVALAVLTADCLPVIFCASGVKRAVGVAHAGWKGLVNGVLENTVCEVAKVAEVPVANVKAWMGPAIGQPSFEVGPEVRQQFVESLETCTKAFIASVNNGKYMADLYRLAAERLKVLDIVPTGGGADTFTDPRYFSHRRSQQHSDQSAGRFATLVRLLPLP